MSVAFKEGVRGVREQVSDEEWQLRCDLAACYRAVAMYGWDDLVFTHISARVPGPEHHFLINPYGLMFDEITASSLVKIDLDGKIVLENGYTVNEAGFVIHSAIHMSRDDAQCVLHLHTDQGIAVSAQKGGLLQISQQAATLIDDLAYHDYEGIAVDLGERERLVADIGAKHFMILRNHGTLTVGNTVGDAFLRMYTLERACKAQVMALAGGVEVITTSDESVRKAGEVMKSGIESGAITELAWPAIVRKLDREDPSFRD
ncbi:MAG: class II aldolase/adducin family protein [Alphaproteobacteria bacterium]